MSNQNVLILAPIPEVRRWPFYGKILQWIEIIKSTSSGAIPGVITRDDGIARQIQSELDARLLALKQAEAVVSDLLKDIAALKMLMLPDMKD